MILIIWTTLLILSFFLIILGYYVNNFLTEPNYILIFLGWSFVFLLSISLFTTDIQLENGFNETRNVTGSVTTITNTTTYDDFGNFNIGFMLAVISVFGAFLQYYHYKTPKIMEGV